MAIAKKAAKKKRWETNYGFHYYLTSKALQHVDEEDQSSDYIQHELPRSELRNFYRRGDDFGSVGIRVNGYSTPHTFAIERFSDGSLEIGCHAFNKAEAAKLKRWATAKAVRKPARKPVRKARKRTR